MEKAYTQRKILKTHGGNGISLGGRGGVCTKSKDFQTMELSKLEK